MSFDPLEFKSKFNSDESFRTNSGQDMSVLGPGAGEQRSTIEGALGAIKNLLLRPEATREQTFRRDASQYLERAYRQETGWGRSLIEEAINVPNYHNLYLGMFMASLYFRQLAGITEYQQLTREILDKYAPTVLDPLLTLATEAKKLKAKKLKSEDYLIQLKGDLLRYLRLTLKK